MISMDAILPATTVKRRFLELLKRLGPERSVITITRNGVPAGVLMSVEEYEALMETLEILADPKLTRSLARARRNFERGRTLTHEQVWREP
jgi:prevent-host-death family protein